MLKYIYDAWGNHKVVDNAGVEITDVNHIGNINPYRYRGYYFDTETGLYYLKSRYYDPQTGRFISLDDISFADPDTINGLNLYAYCCNNPVMHIDPNGNDWNSFWNKVGNWFSNTFGFGIDYENISIQKYYFFVDVALGSGASISENKPVNFILRVPTKWWKIWDYSIGIDFYDKKKERGFQIFGGTDKGFFKYSKHEGFGISIDASGRLKIAEAIMNGNGTYNLELNEINIHNIVGTVMVAIFAPWVLGVVGGALAVA